MSHFADHQATGGGPISLLHTSSTRFNDSTSGHLESSGNKLTTWSNLSKSPYQTSPPQPVIWQSRNREELNNNPNDFENDFRKTKSLPDFDLDLSVPGGSSGSGVAKDGLLVNAFIRGRSTDKNELSGGEAPFIDPGDDPGVMVRSKDTMNQYLKCNPRLTSIEENSAAFGGPSSPSLISSEVVSSGSTLRTANSPKHVNAQRPLTLPPKPQIKFLRKSKSLSTSNGPKQGNLPDF